MENDFIIVGIGEVLWDLLPTGKAVGGAPANFAYHAGQLGAKGYLLSAIGNDALGDELFSNLTEYNLNLKIQKVKYPTGTVNVSLKNGIPNYEIVRNVAWDFIKLNKSDNLLAECADAVCFGTLAQRNEVSRKSIKDFVSKTPVNALRVFDINIRQNFYSKELIEDSIKLANVLKINDEELLLIKELFSWSGSNSEICKTIMNTYQLKCLALTCGVKGSYIYYGEDVTYMPTPLVDVKDTIGAGDAFTAGLVIGLLNNKSIKNCHNLAVLISAYVCSHYGAMPNHTDFKINTL